MRSLIRVSSLILIVVAMAAPVLAQSPPAGSFQWVRIGYGTVSTAYAAAAAGANDEKPPQVITTGDSLVPFVVYRWQFADLWCCPPEHFYAVVLPVDQALTEYVWYRQITYRKAGFVTLPDGNGIAWRTY